MKFVIGGNCVCCHYCKMECPVSAIDYKGTTYAIDQEKCTGCGLCESLCPVSAIYGGDNPPKATEKHGPIDLFCDAVVIGSGGVGVSAAVKLASAGKKVILAEAGKKLGGNTYLAHGAGFTGSKVQASMGVEDNSDQAVRRSLARCLWRADPKKVEENVRATGRFFDWFAEIDGALEPFQVNPTGWMKFDFPYRRLHNLKCRDQAIGPGWMGTWFIEKLLEEGRKYDLTILTEHRAVGLLTEDGAVTGVVCKDPGGETRIHSGAVVLGTGGFLHNEDMMRRHYPWFFEGAENPVHKFNVSTNVGDGHKMAEAAGGVIDYATTDVNLGGPAHHPFGYCAYRIMREPEALYVNMDGHRFMDETGGLNDGKYLLRKQPQAISYCIIDENLMNIFAHRLLDNPPDTFDGWILKDYKKEIDEEIALNDVAAAKADTLRELAEKIGMNADNLVAEIEKYNGFAVGGRDDDCYKDPRYLLPLGEGPYYAFFQKSFSEGTHGGIVIDADLRVLRADGSPIPGLYAGGDCARTDNEKGHGPVGLGGGLGGSFGAGYQIAVNILSGKN